MDWKKWIFRLVLTFAIYSIITENFFVIVLNWVNPLAVVVEIAISYVAALFILQLIGRFSK